MAKRTIKGYAVLDKKSRLASYEEPACHPFLVFRFKYEAIGAQLEGEQIAPVQITIED